MALSVAEQAIVDRFNAATTKISDKIDALIANSANLDDAEFNKQLQAIADGLDALGAPNTPLP